MLGRAKRSLKGERLTVQRNPGEARAGTQTTGYLVNPRIVKLHPVRLAVAELARLNVLPEVLRLQVPACLNRVYRPLALGCQTPKLEGAHDNGTSRRGLVILVATEEENQRAQAEEDGGEQVRTPETDVLLDIDHGDLTGERTDVDEHVEVQEDA